MQSSSRTELHFRNAYFTENSGYRSLKNRNCVTVFGSWSATLTVGKPLGGVSGSANHDFGTSVTGISGEIHDSLHFSLKEVLPGGTAGIAPPSPR